MAHSEDCSSVLEQFVHDVANLPAEINHLMEEIQAKDAVMAECRTIINSRDSSLQKFIRLNGSLAPNAKEESYNKTIFENLDKSLALQEEKMKLAERASALLDRQIKQLDVKLRDLTRAGLLPNDPALPSLLAPKPIQTNMITSADGASGIKPTSGNTPSELAASSASPNTPGGAYTPAQRLAIARSGSYSNSAGGSQATPRGNPSSTAPLATPGSTSAAIHLQRQREASVSGGPDSKRRRLSSYPSGAATASLRTTNELAAPTPRPGTLASAATGQVGGSHGPKTTVVIKKAATGGSNAAGNKRVAPHQQMKKMKVGSGPTKGHKHGSSLGSNRGLKVSSGSGPAVAAAATARTRSPADGMGALQLQSDEEDSVLSSPEGSDVDALTGTVIASSPAADDGELMDIDPEAVEEHVDGEDTKVYCTCRTVSHGDMVACDNENCPYEWFHWKCVGLTREPPGTWYCEECRERLRK